jgi:hypothetical protein
MSPQLEAARASAEIYRSDQRGDAAALEPTVLEDVKAILRSYAFTSSTASH